MSEPEPDSNHPANIPYELRVFQYLIENAFDMIEIVDAELRTIFVSPSTERVLGYKQQEVVGRSALDFIHPEEREKTSDAIGAVIAEGGTSHCFSIRVRHKDGSFRVIDAVVQNLLDDPAIGGLVINYRDVTDQREVESELRRLQERFEKAFRNCPDSITISYMEDGTFLEANEGFERISGYSREEIIGRSALDLKLWRDAEQRNEVTRALETNGRVSDLEAEFVVRGGAVRTCLFSAEVVELNGAPCMLAVTHDITDKRIAAEKLRETSHKLRQDHAELARKNVALKEVLAHLEKEKASYRHELSANIENLLRPIIQRLKENDGRLVDKDIELLEDGLNAIAGRDLDAHKNNMSKLTPRELDICDLIRAGKSSKEMADTLGLSDQTIHKHRQSIRRKLQLDNRGINLAAYLRSRQ